MSRLEQAASAATADSCEAGVGGDPPSAVDGAELEAARAQLAYARAHLEIVERWGRFPHRNALLQR